LWGGLTGRREEKGGKKRENVSEKEKIGKTGNVCEKKWKRKKEKTP